MDILQPAPGAARMGHLLRAVKVTGFVIKWGAHLSTLAAGVLDKTLRSEVDPVILGKAGVSVYEIPAEKEKLPADDWVNVEDLGVEDDTHPKDIGPVKMTTPAPTEKVWLARDVNRTSPVPYSDVNTTTAKPGTSTVRG
jgi:hypothetical protein